MDGSKSHKVQADIWKSTDQAEKSIRCNIHNFI